MIFGLDKQRHVVVLECLEHKGLLDLIGSDGVDSQELSCEGILFILENVPTDFNSQVGAVRDLHVSGDAEWSEPLQMPDGGQTSINRKSAGEMEAFR